MQIESLPIAAIQRWNNKRLAIHAKSDVREKSRVADLVNRFPVARSSIGDTTEFSALGQAILSPGYLSRSSSLPNSCLHHPRMTAQSVPNSE